jgi:hypothetical protein
VVFSLFLLTATPLPLAAGEGDERNRVELRFDARLTPEVVAQSWHKPSVDGSDNIDSDWSVSGYTPTQITVIGPSGRVVSQLPLVQGRAHETRRLARLQRVVLADHPIFVVTVDYSEPVGSFSGDAVFFYEVKNSQLHLLATTLPDGSQRRALTAMNALKSAWRFSPSEQNPRDILAAETLPVSGGFENVFTRVTFADGHWVRHEKHVSPPLLFEFENGPAALERKFFDE